MELGLGVNNHLFQHSPIGLSARKVDLPPLKGIGK